MKETDSLVGTRVDNYEIKRLIGRGGMASVYLAHDVALKRDVVIKTMLPTLAEQEELRLRFQREAQATARLHHPNIVPVYTTGTTPDRLPYIALQYIEGGSLADHLEKLSQQRQWISTIYALAVARQMADALIVAHKAEIIHRDIKPSNILLRNDGTPVLSDLGIAAVQQATVRLTQTGGIMGTPNYMSPEQASSQAIDGRSDIYSLGVILYELLSGRLPFDADSPWAMLHNHIYEPPTPLKQIRPDLTPQTYRVVETCLQKKPADRFRDAAALVAALDEAIAAENANPRVSVGAWQPPAAQQAITQAERARAMTPTQPHAAPQKRPIWPIAAAAVVLLLLIGAGFVFWQQRGGATPSEAAAGGVAVLPTRAATEAPTSTATAEPTATLVTTEAAESAPPGATAGSETADGATPPTTDSAAPLTQVANVTVQSDLPRNDTGIQVESGQRVLLEYVSGSWRAGPAPTWPPVGPDGDPQVSGKTTFPVRGSAVGSLIAGVGGGAPFYVGERTEFVSSESGMLWLAANDDGYEDNEGSLVVRVSVESAQSDDNPPRAAVAPTGIIAFACGSGNDNRIYLHDLTRDEQYLLPGQPGNSVVPAFSPDGARIGYRSNAGGSWQIYTSNVDGTDLRQITSGPGGSYEMVWSPDGRRFAFVSDRTGSKNVYVMNGDGTGQEPITGNGFHNDDPTWSVNGLIAYESDESGRLNVYVMRPDGTDKRLLISHGDTSSTPAWSPDGAHIAFESLSRGLRDIWVATSEGTDIRPLPIGGTDNQRPAWSPDGRWLAFHTNLQQNAEDQFDVWIIDWETNELRRITTRGDCFNPAWGRSAAPNDFTGGGDLYPPTCDLAVGVAATAGENARLWNEPDVTVTTAATTLTAGDVLRVTDGPRFGRILRDQDTSDWWWRVERVSDSVSGWIWQARLQECAGN